MIDAEIKRLPRLTAILTQLQTGRLLTATELATRFSVSVRTIYRDIRALEQSGVPVVTEEGKGYSLMAHYRLPPVMFTEREANALVLAEQLVLKNKDASLVRDYMEATDKVKAVLRNNVKEKANLLAQRTRFDGIVNQERSSDHLSQLQHALTNYLPVRIHYTNETGRKSNRVVEPFALLHTQESWLLIAWCRTRKAFRFFRLDRMGAPEVLQVPFPPHKMTLQEYFDKYH